MHQIPTRVPRYRPMTCPAPSRIRRTGAPARGRWPGFAGSHGSTIALLSLRRQEPYRVGDDLDSLVTIALFVLPRVAPSTDGRLRAQPVDALRRHRGTLTGFGVHPRNEKLGGPAGNPESLRPSSVPVDTEAPEQTQVQARPETAHGRLVVGYVRGVASPARPTDRGPYPAGSAHRSWFAAAGGVKDCRRDVEEVGELANSIVARWPSAGEEV